MKFDNLDRKLLHLLQRDATRSLNEIADDIGLSRNACWRRAKALEEQGVISSRVALLDPVKINLGLTVFIGIRTDHHTAEWVEKFRKAVQDISEIIGVYRMAGDTDYILRAMVPDMKAYDRLYKRLIDKIELSDVSSSFVMEEIKHTTALPLDYI